VTERERAADRADAPDLPLSQVRFSGVSDVADVAFELRRGHVIWLWRDFRDRVTDSDFLHG
jgi:hypothetical protein